MNVPKNCFSGLPQPHGSTCEASARKLIPGAPVHDSPLGRPPRDFLAPARRFLSSARVALDKCVFVGIKIPITNKIRLFIPPAGMDCGFIEPRRNARAQKARAAEREDVVINFIRRTVLVAALALPFAGAFSSAHAAGERFVFVSHAPDSDSWWNTIKNALKNAEHDLGVKVEYRNPSTGDVADMARIIEQASASNPTGIIVTIADYNVLESSVKGAIAKGIPVITVNSGTAEQSKKLGALMHIGQPEYDAGKGAGERAKA